MDTKEMVQRGTILKYPVGSRLYGTNTPDSDEDYAGVFVASKEYYLGLGHIEQQDLSEISKLSNGKNDSNAVDCVLYELRKFVKLALDNNPNIIEQLMIPSSTLIHDTVCGRMLLGHRHLFPHTGCFDKFVGYASSQKKKMIIKSDNMNVIKVSHEYLQKFEPPTMIADIEDELQAHIASQKLYITINKQHVKIGDISIQRNGTIRSEIRKLKDRIERFSGRYELLVEKYGFDTKFASHLIRLLLEGKELLQTGEIKFPLQYAPELLSIKKGNLTVNEVLELATEIEDELRIWRDKTDLPKRPRRKEVENLLIGILEHQLKNPILNPF